MSDGSSDGLSIKHPMILFPGQAQVANDLANQRPNDVTRAMIGNDNQASVGMDEDVVAAFAARPDETDLFGDAAQVAIRHDAKPAHAGTSIFQVPTNSGAGASGVTVLR